MRPTQDEIQTQLNRILLSKGFVQASRMSTFLQFVVDQALKGEADRIKEYVIGIEVFDREAQFDPRLDSIVRVEAGRLRTKIQTYYSSQGADDTILINIPKGQYAPEFGRRIPVKSAATPVIQNQPRFTTPVIAFVAMFSVALAGIALAAWQAEKPANQDLVESASGMRIAILPFYITSDDQAQRLLAKRLTERVTAEFVRVGKLRVISSTSARAIHDNGGRLLQDVAEALQADLLMEARLINVDGNLRVEARISTGAINEKLWVDDFFMGSNTDELARRIAVVATDRILARRQWMVEQGHL